MTAKNLFPDQNSYALSRRSFITAAAGAGALFDLQKLTAAAGDSLIGSAYAQAADDYRCLVCIFMYGGNDANNMIVPVDAAGYASYAARRGPLQLPQASLLPIPINNTGGAPYAIHPAMTGIQKLFQAGKAAAVVNVGPLALPTTRAQFLDRSVQLPPNLFSHSDQQAQWQSSISDGGATRTGWGGRIGDLMQSVNSNRGATCISLAGNNLWENGTALTSYKVSPSGKFGFDFYKSGSSSDPMSISVGEILSAQRTHLFDKEWISVIERSLENQRVMAGAISSQQFANFPNSSIGTQLKMAARLIASRNSLGVKRQTIFCSIGGFDTHGDDQIQRQQQLFGEISAAVSAFYEATATLGVAEKVTTFTASDFGRTLASNSKGSDHGWGSHHFVVGGAVKGSAMYGQFPNLSVGGPNDSGNNGIWVPTTSVDQYAASMARWFGLAPTEIATVFPSLAKFGTPDLGFLT